MSTTFTLDQINDAAERKFGSLEIPVGETTCRLINPVRLRKEKRDLLLAKQEELTKADDSDSDVDQEQVMRDLIRIVCESGHQADVLLEQIGNDLGKMMVVFEQYSGSEELGEASASAA